MANQTAEKEGQKNWTIWQCVEHGRMFAAHAGCSYCREGRPPIRSELSADSPDIQFAAVLKEYERGEAINAADLINALRWRVENQRREISKLQERLRRERMENAPDFSPNFHERNGL